MDKYDHYIEPTLTMKLNKQLLKSEFLLIPISGYNIFTIQGIWKTTNPTDKISFRILKTLDESYTNDFWHPIGEFDKKTSHYLIHPDIPSAENQFILTYKNVYAEYLGIKISSEKEIKIDNMLLWYCCAQSDEVGDKYLESPRDSEYIEFRKKFKKSKEKK